MDLIFQIVTELVYFFNEIAVYLLFGFMVAGILHVVFPDSYIRRHLGKSSLGSVMKSTLFGIPLPICSCGVIPVATSLRSSGASKGATISFLISTPQVGADSFMITYSLLGWVFGVFRIIAALVTSFVSGVLVNLFASGEKDADDLFIMAPSANGKYSRRQRLKELPGYIEFSLLGPIADRLMIGIVIAGLIAVLIPDNFFATYLSGDFLSMLLMLVIGIPMYVCASASTPIAASLIMKGLSPGAALIFLLTGPATNIISISAVHKIIGRKATVIYLLVIALGSLALGYLLNMVTNVFGFETVINIEHAQMLPGWLKLAGSAGLAAMLGWYYIKTGIIDKDKGGDMDTNKIILNVEGMTCTHCSGTVRKTLEYIDGISDITVDLEGKKASFTLSGGADIVEKAISAIDDAGYTARKSVP